MIKFNPLNNLWIRPCFDKTVFRDRDPSLVTFLTLYAHRFDCKMVSRVSFFPKYGSEGWRLNIIFCGPTPIKNIFVILSCITIKGQISSE